MTIKEFADRHHACKEGREWARANCKTMDDAWRTLRPNWLVWVATRPGVLTDRELRLFACWCARRCQPPDADPRSMAAIATAEKFARGEATEAELISAAESAWSAAWSAAWSEAESAHADYVRKLSPCFD